MSFSFQTKAASCGFHISKNTTWENVNIGQEISMKILKKLIHIVVLEKPWSLENWRQSVIYQRRFQGIPTFTLKKKEDVDDDFQKPKVYHTSENEGLHDETLLL